jgi:LacI family transcriptional regulator
MTTLKDLARHLGLSVTQVSRALNGHSDVSAATRARVEAAAAALHYQPNLSARKLVSGRSGIVGLVLQGRPLALDGELFLQFVGGLSAQFSRRGMQFILHVAEPGTDILDHYRRLIDGGALDGFVILEPTVADVRIDYLRERGVPFVVHGRLQGVTEYAFFDVDNHAIGRDLTEILIRAGHRRIAFLNGPRARVYAEERLRGHAEAMAAAGLPVDERLHRAQEMDENYGLVAAVELFSDPARRPTGLVAGSAKVAAGALAGLRALRLRVPQDVSVVAHDDLLPTVQTEQLAPPLTVTASPLEASWAPLAAALAGVIAGEPVAAHQQVWPHERVARQSVAAPAA